MTFEENSGGLLSPVVTGFKGITLFSSTVGNVEYISLQVPEKLPKFGAAVKPNGVKRVLHNVRVLPTTVPVCVCTVPLTW